MAIPTFKVLFETMMCGIKGEHRVSFATVQDVINHVENSTPRPHILELDISRLRPLDFQGGVALGHVLDYSSYSLRSLTLRMAQPGPSDSLKDFMQAVEVQNYGSLVSLRIHGFYPTTLHTSFSNLTHLTLGRLFCERHLFPIEFFLAAMGAWTKLKSLEIEQYSRVIEGIEGEPPMIITMPNLESLKIHDTPDWADALISCLDLPRLAQLHIHGMFDTLPWGGHLLGSWVPYLSDSASALLRSVDHVHIQVAQNPGELTTVAATGSGDRRFVLDAEVPPSHAPRWPSWQLKVLGTIMPVLADVFPRAHHFRIVGDFATVNKTTWYNFLGAYPELYELHIKDIAHREAAPLFLALNESDLPDDQDMLCPQLEYISLHGVVHSTQLIQEMYRALRVRGENEVMIAQLDVYARVLAESFVGDPRLNPDFRSAVEAAVGSFTYAAFE